MFFKYLSFCLFQQSLAVANKSDTEPEPFLEWKYRLNKESGEEELDSIKLSNGKILNEEGLKTAIKKASGTSDLLTGERILKKVSHGFSNESYEYRLNEVSALLPALHPKNETEALLLGQFLALNDSGMKCLRLANLPDQGFYHRERYFALAHKLLNTANQTMQTVLKYRSGGQQTMQVIHVHNEGQAIVAQNLSPLISDEGHKKKF